METPTTEIDTGENAPRDAAYWAKGSARLSLGEVPEGALNLNVEGRRATGPLQGFGKMWQKTYRVRLGAAVAPAEVIRTWKARFPEFWPRGNRFYGPLTGIAPGEVALINLTMPGRVKLSTGVLVLYADDESFTLMTPEGHVFAGWITFSASAEPDGTVAQAQLLIRASDPIYELAMGLGLHRQENAFWQRTLRALAAHFGVDAEPETRVVCVDGNRQWSRAGNAWHNAGVRSGLYLLAGPFRWVARPVRRAADRRPSPLDEPPPPLPRD